MNIDWLHLLAALVLLWLPRQALRLGGDLFRLRHHRGAPRDTNPAKNHESSDPAVVFSREFTKPRNYIDLARGALGCLILLGGFPGFDPAINAPADATVSVQNLAFCLAMLVLIIGVLVQSFRFEARVTMFPPIWYLAGLTFGMPGLKAAAFAFGLIWTVNLVLPNPTAFLTVYALLIAIFGALFAGIANSEVYFMAGMIFLPVLISLLAHRRLVLFNKRVKSGRGTAAAT